MDESSVAERLALVAHHHAAEIAEPGEEPIDVSALPVAAQRVAILRLWLRPVATMQHDNHDAQLSQRLPIAAPSS